MVKANLFQYKIHKIHSSCNQIESAICIVGGGGKMCTPRLCTRVVVRGPGGSAPMALLRQGVYLLQDYVQRVDVRGPGGSAPVWP